MVGADRRFTANDFTTSAAPQSAGAQASALTGLRARSAAIALAYAITACAAPFSSGPAAASDARQPLMLVVDLAAQRMVGYRGTATVLSTPISSGKRGHETPTGVFSIIQKRARHFSNLYNGAPMPHMQRLTWSGIALHGGALPGYPASHGCVRLPYAFARDLFRQTTMGTRVIVTRGMPVPRPVAHALLWQPLPEDNVQPQRDPREPGAPTVRENVPMAGPPSQSTRRASYRVRERILGVMSAEASEPTGPSVPSAGRPPATMREVRARDEARLADLAADAERLEAERDEARARASQIEAELVAVDADLVDARRSLAALEAHDHTWRLKAGHASAQLRKLILDHSHATPGEPEFEAAVLREEALDAALAGAAAEIRSATAEIESLTHQVRELVGQKAGTEVRAEVMRSAAAEATKRLSDILAERETIERSIANADRPVHLLVSRSTGMIHVRQGHQDIFKHPVAIERPDEPLGTHVFSVTGNDRSGQLTWTVVTVPDGARAEPITRSSQSRRASQQQTSTRAPADPDAALSRITLDETTTLRLRAVIKPGSSLIVSDRPPSRETGKGTDFIVLTR